MSPVMVALIGVVSTWVVDETLRETCWLATT
jgi:hypothetical protein